MSVSSFYSWCLVEALVWRDLGLRYGLFILFLVFDWNVGAEGFGYALRSVRSFSCVGLGGWRRGI